MIKTSQISYIRPQKYDDEGAWVLVMAGGKQLDLNQQTGSKLVELLGSVALQLL